MDDYMNAIDAIKENGVQIGLERGEKRGLERGEKRGLERVRREIVLNMLKHKMDLSLIAELSGLSEQEIDKLANGSVSQGTKL